MSLYVLTWVWHNCSTVKANDRLALLALADEADDDGFGFPGYPSLAKKMAASQSCAIDCVTRLEIAELILVNRPQRTGPGQHNEYLVVMDRDLAELRARYDWPADPPAWKSTEWGRNRTKGQPSHIATEGRTRSRRPKPSHIPRSSVAPVRADPDPNPTTRALEQVDISKTVREPRARAEAVDNSPTVVSFAAPSSVDDVDVEAPRPPSRFDGPIADLAAALTEAGVRVGFDLFDDDARTVEQLVAAYGVPTLVTLAVERNAEFPEPPRSVRAFKSLWARIGPSCGSCDPVSRHLLGADGVPVARCLACHPAFTRNEEIRSA